jgi:RND family efflux transporter MFP subunit
MFKSLNIVKVCLLAELAITIIGLNACTSAKSKQVSEDSYPVVSPIIKDTVYAREYVAEIQAIQNIEIHARLDGYLEAIFVDEGRYVKAGQLLFSIGAQQYRQELLKAQAAVASCKAEAKAAEVEFNNTKVLVEKNIVSQSELDVAQAKLEAFRAKTEEALAHEASAVLQLSFAQVKAPFSGFINRIPNKVGSLIDEGTLLTTISDNREVYAYFNVSEKEYLDYVTASQEESANEVSLLLANKDTPNSLY